MNKAQNLLDQFIPVAIIARELEVTEGAIRYHLRKGKWNTKLVRKWVSSEDHEIYYIERPRDLLHRKTTRFTTSKDHEIYYIERPRDSSFQSE